MQQTEHQIHNQPITTDSTSQPKGLNQFGIFSAEMTLVVILLLVGGVGIYFLNSKNKASLLLHNNQSASQQQTLTIQSTPTSENKVASESKCQYGLMDFDIYLDRYTVKPGDTLLSIASKELGSTARIEEIINLNKNQPGYHSLYTSNVIEEGWELYLSSKHLPQNSGDLVAKMGKLSIDKKSIFAGRLLAITDPEIYPTGSPTSFTDNTVFFGAKKFQEGDCVMVIRDEGTDEDIVLALNIRPDYLKSPEATYTLSEVEFPSEQAVCLYDFLESEEVMRKYTVKKGDALDSIAAEQLGNPSRAGEIVEANKNRYVSLNNSNFIEIGWELLLPPKWAVPSSGHLTGFAGTLLREESDAFWVSKDLSNPAHSKFTKSASVTYFGKDNFETGDCVVILNNRGTALGISTQDVNYRELFKYGLP